MHEKLTGIVVAVRSIIVQLDTVGIACRWYDGTVDREIGAMSEDVSPSVRLRWVRRCRFDVRSNTGDRSSHIARENLRGGFMVMMMVVMMLVMMTRSRLMRDRYGVRRNGT